MKPTLAVSMLARLSQQRALTLGAVAVAGLVCATIDLLTGPGVQFPIAYVGPVLVAGYLRFPRTMVLMAAGLTLSRLFFEAFVWHTELDALAAVNAAIRITVLWTVGGIAYVAGTSARRIAALEGILPICSHCKRIRDDNQKWLSVEHYISGHSRAVFSHSLCPECIGRHYPETLK
jgi:hypothetical protein